MTRICVAILLSLVIQLTEGHQNIDHVIDQITLAEKEIRNLKAEVQRVERNVDAKMRVLNLTLRSDLKEKLVPAYMHSIGEASLTEILRLKSIDSMVDSHTMSQIRHLKLEHQKMKTQIQSLSRQLRVAMKTGDSHPPDMAVLREPSADHRVHQTDLNQTNIQISSLQQDVRTLTDQVARLNQSCQIQAAQTEKLESSVDKIRMNIVHLETETENLRVAFDRMNESQTESPENETHVGVNGTSELGSTSPVSSSTPARTTPPTPHNRGDMARILVSQLYTNVTKHALQIDIQNHSMTSYPYLDIRHVWSMVCDPISKRLIYSKYTPDGIFSSPLDVPGFRFTLREGVASYGLTIDVNRRLIFFTGGRKSTVSRMSVWGKKYRRIIFMKSSEAYGSNSALGIAVDTTRKMIYFGKYDGLWSISYNGKNLRRLKSGKDLLGVTVDSVSNILYFGEGKKVLKMPLGTNIISEIREVSGYIFNIVFYNDSLYIITFSVGGVDIINLNNDGDVHFDLGKMKYERNVICLLP